jgi:hypothetical protein
MFSPRHRVQICSGAHPAYYQVGTWGYFSGMMQPAREINCSPTSSAEVKNAWSYTSIPLTSLDGVMLN